MIKTDLIFYLVNMAAKNYIHAGGERAELKWYMFT